jgi:hypothetical protein
MNRKTVLDLEKKKNYTRNDTIKYTRNDNRNYLVIL